MDWIHLLQTTRVKKAFENHASERGDVDPKLMETILKNVVQHLERKQQQQQHDEEEEEEKQKM